MALPDTLERIGIVVGSTFLLSLPTSTLSSLVYGFGSGAGFPPALWLLPGLVVGVLAATDRLAVSYHQLWKFSLTSYFLASLGGAVFDLQTVRLALAVGWWLVAVVLGAVVARVRFRELLWPTGDSSA
ncbi:hypothetical protein [Halorussus lipolyticus]|uniref:hypothetical protein n=1 Tax=Halorussus lipolyticus TaxID=3034024 RepID=UPI0023E77B95|nr:hypothetical protein [Halorussus sp. DT80]